MGMDILRLLDASHCKPSKTQGETAGAAVGSGTNVFSVSFENKDTLQPPVGSKPAKDQNTGLVTSVSSRCVDTWRKRCSWRELNKSP